MMAESGGDPNRAAEASDAHRPPSQRSGTVGTYRLASGIENEEGYLEPRSSAGSFQPHLSTHSDQDTRHSHPYRNQPNNLERHSQQDGNRQSSNSERSSKNSSHLPVNGIPTWNVNKDPNALDPESKRDTYRHEYEELPIGQKYAYAEVSDTGGTEPYTGGSSDNLTSPIYRRRVNPLYDGVTRDESKLSDSTTATKCNRCLCVGMVLLTIVAVVACVLSCLALVSIGYNTPDARTIQVVTTPSYPNVDELLDRLAALEQNITLLTHQVTMISGGGWDNSKLESELSSQQTQITNLSSSMSLIQTNFNEFTTEIRSFADNISKMPGPRGARGPSGAGNLTQCEAKFTSRGTGMGTNKFSTNWIPSSVDNDMYVMFGMECSADTESVQVELQTNLGFNQYRCTCEGDSHPIQSGNRRCEMHYWRCPRIS